MNKCFPVNASVHTVQTLFNRSRKQTDEKCVTTHFWISAVFIQKRRQSADGKYIVLKFATDCCVFIFVIIRQ